MKTALNLWTAIDKRWKRKAVSLGSPVDAERRRPSSVKKTVVEELRAWAQRLKCQWLEGVTAGKVCVLDFLPGSGKICSASGGMGWRVQVRVSKSTIISIIIMIIMIIMIIIFLAPQY